jgi:HK97 family phage major capsid protein
MNEIQQKMEKLFKEYVSIREAAQNETRAMTKADVKRRSEIKTQIDTLAAQMETTTEEKELRTLLYGPDDGESDALTRGGDPLDTAFPSMGTTRGGMSLEKRDYRSLFCRGENTSFDSGQFRSAGEFFSIVASGRFDPRLQQRGLTVGSPSDGGFLVPTEYASELHNVALENEIVLPRCAVEPMFSDEKKVSAAEIGSHSAHLFGGLVGYWKGEGSDLAESTPKFRQMTLKAKKLTALFKFSNEWAADTPNGEAKLVSLAGGGLGWYRDVAFLTGTGAGEPLGILNADCTASVEKETEQQAATIIYANLAKMLGSLHPASFSNAIWVCHVTTVPQLLQLSIPVGTGGSVYPALSESNGTWKLLTRPVIFTEKTETLGSQGDIILADFSQYIVGLRQDIRFDVSQHVAFSSDESYGRLIARVDGQPLWDEALTLKDGTTTVSPFVTLDERS